MSTIDQITHELQRRLSRDCRSRKYLSRIERCKCADGFNVSVQAGQEFYSKPRDNEGTYYKVELGYPSAADDLIQQYAEEPKKPTRTIYGYVPIEIVARLIEKHGGFLETTLHCDVGAISENKENTNV